MVFSLFDKMMQKAFGSSWKTTFFGILAFISGTADLWIDYLKDCGLEPSYMRFLTLVLTLIAFMYAKDKQVTGGSIKNVTVPPDQHPQ